MHLDIISQRHRARAVGKCTGFIKDAQTYALVIRSSVALFRIHPYIFAVQYARFSTRLFVYALHTGVLLFCICHYNTIQYTAHRAVLLFSIRSSVCVLRHVLFYRVMHIPGFQPESRITESRNFTFHYHASRTSAFTSVFSPLELQLLLVFSPGSPPGCTRQCARPEAQARLPHAATSKAHHQHKILTIQG